MNVHDPGQFLSALFERAAARLLEMVGALQADDLVLCLSPTSTTSGRSSSPDAPGTAGRAPPPAMRDFDSNFRLQSNDETQVIPTRAGTRPFFHADDILECLALYAR